MGGAVWGGTGTRCVLLVWTHRSRNFTFTSTFTSTSTFTLECLACLPLPPPQIEEHYISAAELGRLTGVPAEVILRTELTALQVGGKWVGECLPSDLAGRGGMRGW